MCQKCSDLEIKVQQLAAGILKKAPIEGAWESGCIFCGEVCESGPVKHAAGCVVPLAKSLTDDGSETHKPCD